jgi:hypothetical protein
MSAVPEHFMSHNHDHRRPETRPETREEPPPATEGSGDENDSLATFWQWFALAVLLFAWIAEATMCADRGF